MKNFLSGYVHFYKNSFTLTCNLELKTISKNLYKNIIKYQDIRFGRIKTFFFLLCYTLVYFSTH